MSHVVPNAYGYSGPPPARKQHGCLFYGCLITAILAFITILCIALGTYFLYRFTTRIVEQYTDTAAMELPKSNLDEAQIQTLKKRVEDFKKATEEGREDTLTLTGDELTALLQSDAKLKDRIAVAVEGDKLKGQVSLPFDFPGLGRRYFNGAVTLKASLENGDLRVTLDQAEVKGQPVPENVMEHLRKENLAKDAYDKEENARVLRRIKSLEIKDGKIIIQSLATPPAPKPDAAPAPGAKTETKKSE